MTRLILLDNSKNLHEPGVAPNQRMTQQDLDLAVSAPFGQRDDPAYSLKQVVSADNVQGVQFVYR